MDYLRCENVANAQWFLFRLLNRNKTWVKEAFKKLCLLAARGFGSEADALVIDHKFIVMVVEVCELVHVLSQNSISVMI